MSSTADPGRRTLLKLIGGASCAAGAAMIGVPVASAFLSPLGKDSVTGASGFLPTVSLDVIPTDGSAVSVAIVAPAPRDAWAVLPPTEVGTVYLKREGDGVVAMSTICPHLGCKVDVAPVGFRCACHDTDFAPDGGVLKGPSPRGLDKLETKVEGGIVQVKYVRFKTGISEQVPA